MGILEEWSRDAARGIGAIYTIVAGGVFTANDQQIVVLQGIWAFLGRNWFKMA